MEQKWDPAQYAEKGRFVALLAGSLVAELAPQPGEKILDLGCGDGFLSMQIAESGAVVTGVDSSTQMVAAAQERGVHALIMSGESLRFEGEFDGVFSNAALHWMSNQDAVLEGVYRALKPDGRFVAECGGQGNAAAVRVALLAVLSRHGLTTHQIENYHFFAPDDYRAWLERHGFLVEQISLVPRPTQLPSGIRDWLLTFRSSLLAELPAEQREQAMEEIEALLRPALCNGQGKWTVDYVRLRDSRDSWSRDSWSDGIGT
jgi:trans-aconitate methyltransferase